MLALPSTDSHLHGLNAIAQMVKKPLMTLKFYPFGIVRQLETERGTQETLIEPAHLAKVFSQEIAGWETGILTPDIVYAANKGTDYMTISYRDAQMTGVWLDGEPNPIRLPLPPMLLVRNVSNKGTDYRMFAVHKRPFNGAEKLYVPPLPNIYGSGAICWGTVRQSVNTDSPFSMQSDWDMLLGSGFNNHATAGKSKTHGDIREALKAVAKSGTRRYPLADLFSAHQSFGNLVKAFSNAL